MKLLNGKSFLWLQLAVSFALLVANPNFAKADYASDIQSVASTAAKTEAINAVGGKSGYDKIQELVKFLESKGKIETGTSKLVSWVKINETIKKFPDVLKEFKQKELQKRTGDLEKLKNEVAELANPSQMDAAGDSLKQSFSAGKDCGTFKQTEAQVFNAFKTLESGSKNIREDGPKLASAMLEKDKKDFEKGALDLAKANLLAATSGAPDDAKKEIEKAHQQDLAVIAAGGEIKDGESAVDKANAGQKKTFTELLARYTALVTDPKEGLGAFRGKLKGEDAEFAKVKTFSVGLYEKSVKDASAKYQASLETGEKACKANRSQLVVRVAKVLADAKVFYGPKDGEPQGDANAAALNADKVKEVTAKVAQFRKTADAMNCDGVSSLVGGLAGTLKEVKEHVLSKVAPAEFSTAMAKGTDTMAVSFANIGKAASPMLQQCSNGKSALESLNSYAEAFSPADSKGSKSSDAAVARSNGGKKGTSTVPSSIPVGGNVHI